MVHHTKIKLTIEQAAALRVIFKLEFVGKTGHLLKKSKELEDTLVLSHVVRNADIWSRIDAAMSHAMIEAYRREETALNIASVIEVAIPNGMLETIQGILKNGEYLQTLEASKATQQAQLTMGSMVHIVMIERTIEELRKLLKIVEKDELKFYPMKAAEGKN
jgi:hypothetical protein